MTTATYSGAANELNLEYDYHARGASWGRQDNLYQGTRYSERLGRGYGFDRQIQTLNRAATLPPQDAAPCVQSSRYDNLFQHSRANEGYEGLLATDVWNRTNPDFTSSEAIGDRES